MRRRWILLVSTTALAAASVPRRASAQAGTAPASPASAPPATPAGAVGATPPASPPPGSPAAGANPAREREGDDPRADPGRRAPSAETTKPDAPVTSDTSAPSGAGAPTPSVEAARPPEELPHEGKFEFGSYGRVVAATNLRGGIGRGSNVVAFGPRIVDEDSYAELELRREDRWGSRIKSRIVTTVALFPPFFHFTGKTNQAIGVRNLYAQGTYDDVTMWAGSRMYRGDDIYLLNWWPLDNQNTIGGGVGAPIAKSGGEGRTSYQTIVQAHVGQQRLDNVFQAQQVPVVAPFGFGTVNVTKLDRPRTIETLKVTEFIRPGDGASGFKIILYGELHQISAGTFRDPLIQQDRGLPSDTGWLLGSQLTYWTGSRDTYVSLFMRHARGIAAYDPLAVPITFALDRTTDGASETQVALAGNYERGAFGVTAAGYVRFFRDPSPAQTSTQKYDEGALVARPSVFLGEHFGLSFEGSYQQRRLAVLLPGADGPLGASVTKLGVMPYFSPSGRGTFKRPQIRLLYVASFRNQGARALYPIEDVFAQRSTEHFLGLAAEWWFNSSSYP